MRTSFLLNAVHITPTYVNVRRGFTSIKIPRQAIVGIEANPLSGKISFITMTRRYSVRLWRGFADIKRELGYV